MWVACKAVLFHHCSAVDSAGCFGMHLTDAVAIDAMLRHLAAREEILQKAVQDLQPVVMSVSRDTSWKKDLSSESSLDEVRAAANQLAKVKLKGAPFANSLETFTVEADEMQSLIEACRTSAFCQHDLTASPKESGDTLCSQARQLLRKAKASKLVEDISASLAGKRDGVEQGDIQPVL
ncbi:unnamed protein product [Symbiodinium sp. CCMP2592]|nr:unnamed protein product [Symbiodinium sp. CCMP2592]